MVSLAPTPLGPLAAADEGAEGPLQRAAQPHARATGAITLVPLGHDPVRVSGLHSYLGSLEVRPAADGLVIENELPLEQYLLGLNEVPLDWPMEALRAQAIAARTYALWTLGRPRAGAAADYGFDICASEQCQVYSGADVVRTEDGRRWRRAVLTTAGRAIVFDGKPILARYHSTSGGKTLDNHEAFEGEPDLPYLRGVTSPFERASPLYRWSVRFTLPQLQAILDATGWWSPSRGRLEDVHTVASSSERHYPDVVLVGRTTLRRSAEELRAMLREVAPRLFPRRYPSAAGTGSGRLPETLPSNRVAIATRRGIVEIVGRGWGHGVGLSQWGAHGMAERGSDHEVILAHYYPGTSLRRMDEAPVEVGIAWGRESVEAFGAFRIVDRAGATLVERALGTWRFEWRPPDGIAIVAPRGYGRQPRVSLVRAPETIEAGASTAFVVHLTAPARVSAGIQPIGGGATSPAVTRDAGRRAVPWRAPSRPGRYRVRVRASDGGRARYSEAVEIVVTEARRASHARDTGGPRPAVGLWAAAVAFAAIVALGCASFVGTIRR